MFNVKTFRSGFLRSLVSLFVISFVMFLVSSPARADDASLGRKGEAVRPVNDSQVEMVSEEVVVTVSTDRSRVDCRFTFKNTGPSTTVLMGFPESKPLPDREGFGDNTALHDFRTFIDGGHVSVKKEKGDSQEDKKADQPGNHPYWWTWEVPFGAGETREVRNTYRVNNHYWSNGQVLAGYILSTGSYWKGPIGKVRVVFRFEDVLPHEMVRIFPGTHRFEGNDLVWEWTDLEPRGDIEIIFNTRRWPEIPIKWGEIDSSVEPFFTQFVKQDSKRDSKAALATLKELRQALQAEYKAKHMEAGFSEIASAIDLVEARYRFQLGQTEFGRGIWEQELKSGNVDPQIYYYLGTLYHKKGQLKELLELNRQIKTHMTGCIESNQFFDFQTWKILQRWLASLLPDYAAEKIPDGNAAPVLKKVTISPVNSETPASFCFKSYVEDRDEDLVHIGFGLWYVKNGIKFMIHENRDNAYPPRYGPEGYTEDYVFSAPSPESNLYYRIEAVDMAGHRLDTGDVRWNKNDSAVIKDSAQEAHGPDGKDNLLTNNGSCDSWEGKYLYFIVIGGLQALLVIIFCSANRGGEQTKSIRSEK